MEGQDNSKIPSLFFFLNEILNYKNKFYKNPQVLNFSLKKQAFIIKLNNLPVWNKQTDVMHILLQMKYTVTTPVQFLIKIYGCLEMHETVWKSQRVRRPSPPPCVHCKLKPIRSQMREQTARLYFTAAGPTGPRLPL